jgi:hypothetical protein
MRRHWLAPQSVSRSTYALSLALALAIAASACGSTGTGSQEAAADNGSSEPPSARDVIGSMPFEPTGHGGNTTEWSGYVDSERWTLSTRTRGGERCVQLELAGQQAEEVCEVEPTADTDRFEPIIPLIYKLAPDEQGSVIVGLVPTGTSSIEMSGADTRYDIYLDSATGVFVFSGAASGSANALLLTVGSRHFDCTIADRNVSGLAYLCS